jgi:hypothetical protein
MKIYMIPKLIVILLIYIPLTLNSQSIEEILLEQKSKYKTGSQHTYEENTGEILEIPVTRGEAFPSDFSLKEYVPDVLLQEGGSCASFSSCYYGMTTYNRYKNDDKTLTPFNPMNLHSRILSFLNTCENIDNGVPPGLALFFMRDYGICTINDVDSLNWVCEVIDPFVVYPNKLISWKKLNNSTVHIDKVKYAISKGNPIFAGISTNFALHAYGSAFRSFASIIEDDIDETYFLVEMIRALYDGCANMTEKEVLNELKKLNNLKENEPICWSGKYPQESEGGHGVCIIGYDDNKFGGAFEIVNSWGDDWADKGFIWIRYKDFYKMYPDIYMIGN